MTTAETPTLPIAAWLASVLGGDAQLAALAPGGVYGRGYRAQQIRRLAPAWPAVRFGLMQGGKETYLLSGAFSYAKQRYEVEVIDKSGDQTGALAAAARVHALISDPRNTDQSGCVQRCVRTSAIDRAEVADGGAQFQHVGGTYEIWVRG